MYTSLRVMLFTINNNCYATLVGVPVETRALSVFFTTHGALALTHFTDVIIVSKARHATIAKGMESDGNSSSIKSLTHVQTRLFIRFRSRSTSLTLHRQISALPLHTNMYAKIMRVILGISNPKHIHNKGAEVLVSVIFLKKQSF